MEAPATLRARKAVMWTREDCRKLEGMGLLPERWELVQGEIIGKTDTSLPHSRIAMSIMAWLIGIFPGGRVLPTCSIDVAPEDNPTSEPEPDITVLHVPADQLGHNPRPEDIALLIEVSDTTLDHDLGAKAKLYARAGIAEYWGVDLKGRRIHQHREPGADGYASLRIAASGESLSPLALPKATITPDVLFA